MSGYSNFLHRLNAYREASRLTQKDMAEMFGVHQSHYGRYEAGERGIGFKSLQCFEDNGGDLFLLITGCERPGGPMGEYLKACKTDSAKVNLIGLLVWSIDFGFWMDGRDKGDSTQSVKKCIRLLEANVDGQTLWERIRKTEGLTQIEMAALLDIEVKRYRRIEKAEIEPDVEVLCNLYDKLQYSPQMFFDIETFYVDELNFYWNMLSLESKEFLEKLIDAGIQRIKLKEIL